MIKPWVAALATLAGLTGAAQAQDFLQPGRGLASNFAGIEAGVELGAGVGGAGDVDTTGVAGGAYVGYNFQQGPIVGGVEADAMAANVSGGGRGGNLSQNALASARVRGGFAFGNVLAYGTIGPAWATSSFETKGYTASKSLQGYAVGAGAEVGVTRNISARAELRHYEMGAPTYYTPTGTQKIANGNNFLIVGVGAKF